ncbi:MAG TPA: vWA domain-containing protein [Marinobacter sp.]|nr:vWA domain-containing protein [Marinobacter sp.]
MAKVKRMWIALVMALVFPATAAAQDSAPGADVRIVVDISGSMKETDPSNLRRPAVRLLARMLPSNASAGLWTFGQYVNMLVPYGEVDQAWRDTMVARSEDINSVGLYTNLGLALEKATDDWLSGGSLANTQVIVLSDGKVDVPGDDAADAAERRRILDTLLPDLAARGATIHAVGLSELADVAMLRQLGRDTGGSFQLAQNAEALNLAFANALNRAVPQQQLPIEGDGFSVDSGVQEFTALIFSGRNPAAASGLQLAEPGGTPFGPGNLPGNVRWASESGYDLITVTDPAVGRWQILGELGQGSRVTVVSDLAMDVSQIPAEFSEQEPLVIAVRFTEDGKALTNTDFLSVMDVRLSITASDGRTGTKTLSPDAPPEDGIYRDTVPRLPASGRYQIDVVADGGTFSRKFSAMTSFLVPGEELPLEVVSEPLVPDLSEQVAPLDAEGLGPVGENAATAGAPEAEPTDQPPGDVAAEVSEPAPEVQAEPTTDQPDATAAADGEAATSADVQPGTETGTVWGLPIWMLAAGAAGLALIGGLGAFAWKQRKAREDAEQAAAAERETLDDLDDSEPPVVVAELEPERQPEPEDDIPEVTEPVADDDIPLADDALDEPELGSEPEPEPEPVPEPSVPSEPEPAGDDSAGDDALPEDEDEFGLEDFDLSEFDDLPDYSEEDHDSDAEEWGRDDKTPKK